MKEPIQVSCGVIITDGEKLLGCHPWGRQKLNLDIPKGRQEEGETYPETAVREVQEETGLQLDPEELVFAGRFSYIPDKDLVVFVHVVDELPALNTLKCRTSALLPNGKRVPEVTGYEHVRFNDSRFYKSLQPILQQIDIQQP